MFVACFGSLRNRARPDWGDSAQRLLICPYAVTLSLDPNTNALYSFLNVVLRC